MRHGNPNYSAKFSISAIQRIFIRISLDASIASDNDLTQSNVAWICLSDKIHNKSSKIISIRLASTAQSAIRLRNIILISPWFVISRTGAASFQLASTRTEFHWIFFLVTTSRSSCFLVSRKSWDFYKIRQQKLRFRFESFSKNFLKFDVKMANCSWVQFSLAEKMVISWIVSVAENATESNLIETAFISSRIPSKTFSVNPYEPVPDELKFKLENSNFDSRPLGQRLCQWKVDFMTHLFDDARSWMGDGPFGGLGSWSVSASNSIWSKLYWFSLQKKTSTEFIKFIYFTVYLIHTV